MERWNWKMIQAPRKGTNLTLNSSEPFLDGKMMRSSKKLILVSFAQLTLLREVVLNLFWGQRLIENLMEVSDNCPGKDLLTQVVTELQSLNKNFRQGVRQGIRYKV